MRIACGQRAAAPFPESELIKTRAELRRVLTSRGLADGQPLIGDRPQAFEVRLIGELAKACGDPDYRFTEIWARGVWVGSKERPLPRTPSVFDRKTKWRLGELDPDAQPEWRTNYSSTAGNSRQARL